MAGILKTIGSALKKATSAIVGIPVAIVSTTVLAASYAVAESIRVGTRSRIKLRKGGGQDREDEMAAAVADFFAGAIASVWKNYGAYPYIKGAEMMSEYLEELQSESGFGRSNPFSTDALLADMDDQEFATSVKKKLGADKLKKLKDKEMKGFLEEVEKRRKEFLANIGDQSALDEHTQRAIADTYEAVQNEEITKAEEETKASTPALPRMATGGLTSMPGASPSDPSATLVPGAQITAGGGRDGH